MSTSHEQTWLVAYDIREPRRLRQLHRFLRRQGTPVQYSAFCVEASSVEVESLVAAVRRLIDERVDDVRAYHVPAHCRVWQLGRQQFPDGVYVEGSAAVRQLLQLAAMEPAPAEAPLR